MPLRYNLAMNAVEESDLARRIWLSVLALLVAFIIGLSLIASVGAIIIVRESNLAAPVQVIPAP